MIVGTDRRRLLAERLKDLDFGDLVRRKGHRGVGIIESDAERIRKEQFAWVAWGNGRKDYLPLVALRRVPAKGSEYDARRDA